MYKITVPVILGTTYAHKEETLAELKRCGAQRVAIAPEQAFEKSLISDEALKKLKELIKYFKENGFEVLVWVNSLGHDRITPPQNDLGYDYIEYIERGKVDSLCPMGEAYSAAYADMLCDIAKCGAEMIMIDDDFRMGLGFGCCCDMHMKAFCEELDEDVPVEGLKYKLLKGGKNKYRSAWLTVQGDGLRKFAKKMRNAVDKINPNIRLGACVTMGSWDADGADAIEIAKILAGKTKPFIRTFGAPYHTTLGLLGNEIEEERFLGNVVEKVRTQLKWCENEGIEIFVEGDTYPRPRFFCPASYLECYDMILRADGQADGILKYMIDYSSSPGFETGYVDAMVKNEALYKDIEEMFKNKKAIGVRPYLARHTIESAELDCDKLDTLRKTDGLAFDESSAYELLTSNSLPCTYEDNTVKVVFGESARQIPEEAMNSGLIIDIVAAKLLMQRGIDVGIETIDESDKPVSSSKYDMGVEYFIDEGEAVSVSAIEVPKILHKSGVKVLTKYQKGTKERDFVFEYENSKGQKFLVFPFIARTAVDKMGIFKSYPRRRQLIKSIERINEKPLNVHPDGNYPMLYTLAKENESEISVGLWNLFADKIENAKIKVNSEYTSIKFINCSGHKDKEHIVLDSVLYPFEFAGIRITK